MIKRQLNLLEFALNSLLRRWKKNLTLLIVFTLVVAFFSSVLFLSSGLRKQAKSVLAVGPQLWVQKLVGGRLEPVALSMIDTLRTMRGIKEIRPRIWGYYYDGPSDAIYTVMGGGVKSNLNVQKDSALVGSGFAQLHRLKPGQRFLLQVPQNGLHGFYVQAILEQSSDLITRDLIVLPQDSARKVLGMEPATATDLGIYLFNEHESTNLAGKISRTIPGLRVVTRQQLLRTYEYLFSWRGGLLYFGGLLSLLAFLLLVWDKASGLSAEEKRELGILKGMGWQVQEVLWMRLYEAGAIACTAGGMGILLAVTHINLTDAALLKPLLAGWSQLYPSYRLPLFVDWHEVSLILVLSIIPYLAANLFPAWRAAVTPVDQLLKNQ